MISKIKQFFCDHKFDLNDMKLTGILELKVPTTNGYDEWIVYFKEMYTHDSVTKRVKWPCAKCGKVFYAHCGLDIIHDGNIIRM